MPRLGPAKVACALVTVLAICLASAQGETCSYEERCCPYWVTVFERSNGCMVSILKDASEINELFESTQILKYEVNDVAVAYLKEEKSKVGLNVTDQVLYNWIVESEDYGVGKHFVLYSSEDDLLASEAAWDSCPVQDNLVSGEGIPGSCRASSTEDSSTLALQLHSCEEPKQVRVSVCSFVDTNAPTTTFPSAAPTKVPTPYPTEFPTFVPTARPTRVPTVRPTQVPTLHPSKAPSASPTVLGAVSRTVAPTSEPSTACPEGSMITKLEIGVTETGAPFCPGLVDFRVVLEHKLARSPNLGLEVSFTDTGETLYSPLLTNCSELADGSSMECVISANGTPPDADWALRFLDLSSARCTFHDNYRVTMPAADDTECADYELTTLCANKEDSLASVKASFGGELATTVQGLSSEARLWCEVRSSSEDTLASLSVFVDSSEGRVTCGNGVVVAEPHYVYIMSDTWTTPMYRVSMGDPCETSTDSGSTTEAESEEPSSAVRIVFIVAIAVGGALALGILATLFVRMARRLRQSLTRERAPRRDSWSIQERQQELAPHPGFGSNAHELVCSPNDVNLATFGHRNV